MVSKNSTDDYVVLRGPSKIDPNVYKTATLLIFSVAVIALVFIQICRKKYLQRLKMCRCYYKDSGGVDGSDAKKISMQSTSCPSSNRSEVYRKASEKTAVEDPAREIHLPMLDPVPVESADDGNVVTTRSAAMVSFQVGEDPEKIEMVMEQLIEDTCVSCIPTSSASENKFAKQHEPQTRRRSQNELQISNLDASNSLLRRKRRSAVCVSMPHGQDLPETLSPTLRRSEDVWKQRKEQVNEDFDGMKDVSLQKNQACLPELQLNGQTYNHEPESNDNFSKVEDMDDDAADEGQLQCVVKYDEKQSTLNLKSIIVRTTMDPGVPGFLVEASLLPRRSVSVKSKVYLSAQREVDLTINEVFNLRCSTDDIDTNSLFIAVKPMFSNVILFAETELRDLSLSHEKEVMLGGNLKSLSTNLS